MVWAHYVCLVMGDRHFTAKEELTLAPPPAEKGTDVFLEVVPASSTSPVWPTPLASFPGSPCTQTKNRKERGPAFLNCKRWKAGQGLGTRLHFALDQIVVFQLSLKNDI